MKTPPDRRDLKLATTSASSPRLRAILRSPERVNDVTFVFTA